MKRHHIFILTRKGTAASAAGKRNIINSLKNRELIAQEDAVIFEQGEHLNDVNTLLTAIKETPSPWYIVILNDDDTVMYLDDTESKFIKTRLMSYEGTSYTNLTKPV